MIDLTQYDRMKKGLEIIFENPNMTITGQTFTALMAMSDAMKFLAEEINNIEQKTKEVERQIPPPSPDCFYGR